MAARIRPKPRDFITTGQEYTVSEFDHLFGNTIPHLVLVTKGGPAEDRELTKGQVLTIQTTSKQTRVVARALDWGYPELYSIPTGVQQHFTVLDRNGKATRSDESMYSLLGSHELPVRVRFAKGHVMKHQNKRVSTSQFPQLELMYTFLEAHVLGNIVKEDTVTEDVINIPVHDSSLRLTMVTGLNGTANDVFRRFKDDVEHACGAYEYDMLYGRIDISVYETNDIHRRLASITRCTKPTMFTNFGKLFDRPKLDVPAEDSSMYECPMPGDEEDNEYETIMSIEKSQIMKKHIATQPKPVVGCSSGTAKIGEAVCSGKRSLPPKPAPKPAPKPVRTDRTGGEKAPDGPIYKNDIPRGQATPFVSQPTATRKLNEEITAELAKQKMSISKTDLKSSAKVSKDKDASRLDASERNISKLSIDEVCEYLKLLKLEKHVCKFQEQLIDGEILNEMDKPMLMSELGFSVIEAIRLMKFIKEGHIPK